MRARGFGLQVAHGSLRRAVQRVDPVARNPAPHGARHPVCVDGETGPRGESDPFTPQRRRGRSEVGERADPEHVQRIAQIRGRVAAGRERVQPALGGQRAASLDQLAERGELAAGGVVAPRSETPEYGTPSRPS